MYPAVVQRPEKEDRREAGSPGRAVVAFAGLTAILLGGCSSSAAAAADSGTPTGVGIPRDAGIPRDGDVAITGLPAEKWTWVPVEGALCRDRSPTGVGVNLNPNSTKLMIFLEGGGVCFDAKSCANNAYTVPYGQTQFQSAFGSGAAGGGGVFDRSDPKNPMADWSFVYLPYCTGDLHAGNTPAGHTPDGVGPEAFVGYRNVTLDLARLVPTFTSLTEVLLTGTSGGGFGALFNYDQVASAFAGVSVALLDDSGPPMSTPYLAGCMQTLVTQVWNLETTVLADCGADCRGDAGFALPYLQHVVGMHSNAAFGLADSTADGVMSEFFGVGQNNCASQAPLPAATFQAGLLDIRTQMGSHPNFGLFAFTGNAHTSLKGSTFDARTAADAGFPLTEWTAGIVAGHAINIGP